MTTPLSAELLPNDLLQAWADRFINRTLPYAVQQADGSYRWRYEKCTAQHLAAHIRGEITLALSSTDAHGQCRWVCLDVDDPAPDAFARLLKLRAALSASGFPGLLEASRRGGHLWLFLETPMLAGVTRRGLLQLLEEVAASGVDVPSGEIYPDASVPSTLGHAVRLPLGIHRLSGQRYPLFDLDDQLCAFTTAATALRFGLNHPCISKSQLATVATRNISINTTHVGEEHLTSADSSGMTSTRSRVIRWINAHISPHDLLAEFAPTVQPRHRGQGYLGWCPFHDDRAADDQGHPGTPSFYVVHNSRHGWSWRCLSTNYAQNSGPMRHSFRLWHELLGTDPRTAIAAALLRWPEAGVMRP